jgi:hypothetical protein
MDKGAHMLRMIEATNNLFTAFLIDSDSDPNTKDLLGNSIISISDLSISLSELFPKVVNPVNDKELEFCEKIQQVASYGIRNDHQLAVAAAERLVTYLREKIALIHVAIEGANPSSLNS